MALKNGQLHQSAPLNTAESQEYSTGWELARETCPDARCYLEHIAGRKKLLGAPKTPAKRAAEKGTQLARDSISTGYMIKRRGCIPQFGLVPMFS